MLPGIPPSGIWTLLLSARHLSPLLALLLAQHRGILRVGFCNIPVDSWRLRLSFPDRNRWNLKHVLPAARNLFFCRF